jgi:hypothetical protein
LKNVIFDLGGVVLEWNPERILAGHYCDPAARAQMKTALFQHADWLQLDRGTLEEPELLDRLQARTGRPAHELAGLLDAVRASLHAKPDTVALLNNLAARGIPLYCLSNVSSRNFAYVRERHAFRSPDQKRRRRLLIVESGGVLRLTIAERPILFLYFHEIDEDVFAAQVQSLVQTVGDSLVEGSLHVERPSLIQNHLNQYCVLGSLDSQIGRVDDQVGWRVLGDDLKSIVLRHIQDADHRVINDFANGASILGRLPCDQINAC